jgi:hypothetical protein
VPESVKRQASLECLEVMGFEKAAVIVAVPPRGWSSGASVACPAPFVLEKEREEIRHEQLQ